MTDKGCPSPLLPSLRVAPRAPRAPGERAAQVGAALLADHVRRVTQRAARGRQPPHTPAAGAQRNGGALHVPAGTPLAIVPLTAPALSRPHACLLHAAQALTDGAVDLAYRAVRQFLPILAGTATGRRGSVGVPTAGGGGGGGGGEGQSATSLGRAVVVQSRGNFQTINLATSELSNEAKCVLCLLRSLGDAPRRQGHGGSRRCHAVVGSRTPLRRRGGRWVLLRRRDGRWVLLRRRGGRWVLLWRRGGRWDTAVAPWWEVGHRWDAVVGGATPLTTLSGSPLFSTRAP